MQQDSRDTSAPWDWSGLLLWNSPGRQAAQLHSYVTRIQIVCVTLDTELADDKGVGRIAYNGDGCT